MSSIGKVVIFYSSIGYGHISAAQSISCVRQVVQKG